MKRIHLLLLLLGSYLLSACSGNLSAKVFLDRNGDNKLSSSEPVLASLPATLYQDGAEVEKLNTDAEGNVNFFIKQKGKFCVRIDETELTQLSQKNLGGSNSVKALSSTKSEVTATPDPTPEATASPKPSPSPAGQSQTSSTPKNTVKAYEACTETNGPVSVSLDVPVPIDFRKTIASIPDPVAQTVSPGDEVELPIIFPKYCDLKMLTLPVEVGIPAASGDMIHEINWNSVIAAGGKPIVDTPPSAVNHDTLRQFPLQLQVADDIKNLDQDLNIEITPQVSCPGGLELDLKTHVLSVARQRMFEIYHDREGNAVAGGEVTIITHVINETNRSFEAGDVRLSFTTPIYGDLTFDSQCGGSHCSFAIAPQEHKYFHTKIKIPDSLEQSMTFQLSAELKVKVDGSDKIFPDESPAQFGVLPN